MKKETSFFSGGQVAKSFKKFPAYVLDYILAVILHVIFFALIEGIMNVTPLIKGYQNDISSTYSSLVSTVVSTSISEIDDSGELLSQNQLVKNYIYGSVKNTLKDKEGFSSDVYQDYKIINSTNDYAYNYYVKFKVDNIDSFAYEKENCGISYYKSTYFSYTSSSYFTGDDYPSISYESCEMIDEYIRNSSYSKGEEIYTSIYEAYATILQKGMSDIQANYNPFISLNLIYEKMCDKIVTVRNIELFISYIIVIFIVYFMFPLIFKDGRTLAMKVLKIGAVNKDNNAVTIKNLLIKFCITFIEMFSIIVITPFIFYSTDALELVGISIIFNISYLSLGLFSLIVMLFSFILSFLLRDTRQTLTEFLSMEILKDSDVFEITSEVSDEEKFK